MSGVAPGVSTPRSAHLLRRGPLDSPGNLFSQKIRGKEEDILKQKITSRLNEVEKDGTEILKNIEKLRTQVEVMLEDARFIVDDLETIENPRKCYQDVSQRLVEVEDGIAMLAACIAQWQSSSAASSEFNETSNNGNSSRYLVTEPGHDGLIELEQNSPDGDNNFSDSSMEKQPSLLKAKTSLPLLVSTSQNERELVTDNTNVRGTANLSVNNSNLEKLELGHISKSDNEKEASLDYSTAGNLKSVVRSLSNKPCLTTDKLEVEKGPLQGPQFRKPTSRPEIQPVVKQGPQKQLVTRCISPRKVNVKQDPNISLQSQMKPRDLKSSNRGHSNEAKFSNCDGIQQDFNELGPQNAGLMEENTSNLDSFAKDTNAKSEYIDMLKDMPLVQKPIYDANSEYMYILKDLPVVQKPKFDEQKIKEETIHFNKELKKVRLAREKMLLPLDVEPGASLDHLKSTPIPKTDLDLIEESNSERLQRITIENLGKKLCSLEAGHVGLFTFVEGCPSMFWIYKEGKGLCKLQDYLETRYGQGEGDGGGEGLASGSPVLAKYSLDGRYFRAKVEEVVVRDDDAGECMYSVCYMDYGNSEVVSGRELISWDSRLEAVPEQAVSCCLADGPDQWREDGWGSWTGEQLSVFHQTMKEGELTLELHTDIRKKDDPMKPMFTAFVWVNGISVVEILKKHQLFSHNLVHCEPKKFPHQKNLFASSLTPIDKTVMNLNETQSLVKPENPDKHAPVSPVNQALVSMSNKKVSDWLQGIHSSYQPKPHYAETKSPVAASFPLTLSPAPNSNKSRLRRTETNSPVTSTPQLPSPSIHKSSRASNQTRPHYTSTKFNVEAESHLPSSTVDQSNPACHQSKPHYFQTDPVSTLSPLPSSPKPSFIPIGTFVHKHHRAETKSPARQPPSSAPQGNPAFNQSGPRRSEAKSIAASTSQLPSDSAREINRASKQAKSHHEPPVTAIHNVGTLQILVDENACFNLTMSTIDNPGQFFVRPVQGETKWLDDISIEIQCHPLTTPEERLAVPGTVWAIMNGTKKWFRVRIEKCDSSGVSIRYIDYGGTQHNVGVGRLRQLPATWVSELPGLAVPCHLAGCQPKGGKWENTATALLEEFVGYEREHKAILVGEEAVSVGISARSIGVVLLAEDVVINRKMVEWGFAESQLMDYFRQIGEILMDSDNNKLQENWNPMKDDFIGSLENNYETNQEDVEMATTGYTSKNLVCPNFELRGECFRGQFCELRHVYTTRPAVTEDREEIAVETFTKLSLPCPGRTVYVEISEVTSPSLFYCVLALGNSDIKHVSKQDVEERVMRRGLAGQDTLASFMNHMQVFYGGRARTDFTAAPALGELVACVNPYNNLWCRGRVTANREAEVKDYYENNEEEGKAVVFFVDFGQTQLVDLSQMRRLETRFTTFPLQAVECCLAGVMPMGTSWTEKAIQEFTKMVQKQWLMAQVVSCEDSRIFIDLLIPGDPGNDVYVAEELKKMGLARIDKFLSPNVAGDHIIKMPG